MVSLRVLTLASVYQVVAAVVLVGLGLWWWPSRVAAVGLGSLVMTINFFALRLLAARALGGSKPKVAYALALSLKFAAVAGLLALFVLVFELDVLGLALGMSSLFFGIGLATAHVACSAPPAPAVESRTT